MDLTEWNVLYGDLLIAHYCDVAKWKSFVMIKITLINYLHACRVYDERNASYNVDAHVL